MHGEVWQKGNTDAALMNDTVLFSRIAQTVAWCQILYERGDRDPKMRPKDIRFNLLHEGRDAIVCEVGYWRGERIMRAERRVDKSVPILAGGRLMVYIPDWDMCDGIAEAESEGFFDAYNTPPWDTWIGYFNGESGKDEHGCAAYLLAYVPEHFVWLAGRGIECNPEQCIKWLPEAPVKMRDRLALILDNPST